MCFAYLWLTDGFGKEVMRYKKEKRKTPNVQLANHRLFKIPKKADFTLAELNSGFFDALMDAISIQDSFKDTDIIEYVFVKFSLIFSNKKLMNYLNFPK